MATDTSQTCVASWKTFTCILISKYSYQSSPWSAVSCFARILNISGPRLYQLYSPFQAAPSIWPFFIKVSSFLQVTWFVMFHLIEHSDVWLNETKAFNAVIAMSLTTILITVIVMGQIAVFFFWFERIFHQKKSFCTTTFLYTTTCEYRITSYLFMTDHVCSFGADVCHTNLYHNDRLEVRLWRVSWCWSRQQCRKVRQHCILGAGALQLRDRVLTDVSMIIK